MSANYGLLGAAWNTADHVPEVVSANTNAVLERIALDFDTVMRQWEAAGGNMQQAAIEGQRMNIELGADGPWFR